MYDFKKEYLYHYTSFEAAVKIVASGKLLFSETKKLNDINESNGPAFICENENDAKVLQDEILKYRQISFSTDKSQYHKGYDIPAMWGHYASRGQGVCLVFEKERLLEIIKNQEIISGLISYQNDINPIDRHYECRFGDIKEFLELSIQDFFFTKTKDWEYENEFRLLTSDPNTQFVEFKDSLSSIILNAKNQESFKKSADANAFSSLVGRENIYRYSGNFMKPSLYTIDGHDIFPELNYDFAKYFRKNDVKEIMD